MEQVKSIFSSKTFIFNVIAGVIGVLTSLGADQLTDLGINGVAQKWVLFAIGLIVMFGNIYLRSITNTPVTTPLTKTP